MLSAPKAIETHDADTYTIINGFHHLPDVQKEAMMRAAAQKSANVLIVECADTHAKTLSTMFIVPVSYTVFALTHFKRLSWTQRLFSFVIPILPFAVAYDAFASCTRVWKDDELSRLVSANAPEARIERGRDGKRPMPVNWWHIQHEAPKAAA